MNRTISMLVLLVLLTLVHSACSKDWTESDVKNIVVGEWTSTSENMEDGLSYSVTVSSTGTASWGLNAFNDKGFFGMTPQQRGSGSWEVSQDKDGDWWLKTKDLNCAIASPTEMTMLWSLPTTSKLITFKKSR